MALSQIEGNFPSQDAFRTALKQQGLTLAQLRPLVRDRVLEQRLRARVTANAVSRAGKDQAWLRWLIAAYRSARVNVNPRYGTLDLQTQTIVNPATFPGAAPASASPSPSPSG
jgi:hypothetical protein